MRDSAHLNIACASGFQAEPEEQPEQDIFVGKRAAIYTIEQVIWIFITLGFAYVVYWIESLTTTYRITTQRIIIRRGLFSTTTHVIEFVRVHNFRLKHPWNMRLLGYGILQITSSTPRLSHVDLYGIRNIDTLYEQLRCAVRDEQGRARVKQWKEV